MKAYTKKDNDDWLYTIYVTDALKVIAGNTVGFVKEGRVMKDRYYDLIMPKTEAQEEKKSAKEIADSVISRFKRG